MNLTSKPIRLGVPTLIILGLVAVIAFMAWGTGGSASGLGATSMLRGTVEYTVRDANGNIKDHGINTNAVAAAMLTSARNAMGRNTDIDGGDVHDLYDAIELCQADSANSPTTLIDDGICTTLSSADNLSTDNPGAGTTADVNSNAYSVTLMFTAINPVVIEGFHLCGRNDQSDGVVCPADEIGAYQNTGTINLANTDTIQVVWTITFDAA